MKPELICVDAYDGMVTMKKEELEALVEKAYQAGKSDKVEHQELWHYEQALEEIREMIEDEARKFDPCLNCQEFYCDECMWKDKRRANDE